MLFAVYGPVTLLLDKYVHAVLFSLSDSYLSLMKESLQWPHFYTQAKNGLLLYF